MWAYSMSLNRKWHAILNFMKKKNCATVHCLGGNAKPKSKCQKQHMHKYEVIWVNLTPPMIKTAADSTLDKRYQLVCGEYERIENNNPFSCTRDRTTTHNWKFYIRHSPQSPTFEWNRQQETGPGFLMLNRCLCQIRFFFHLNRIFPCRYLPKWLVEI